MIKALHKLLTGDLIASFQYLKGAYKKDGDKLFRWACYERTRGNGFELKDQCCSKVYEESYAEGLWPQKFCFMARILAILMNVECLLEYEKVVEKVYA